MIRNIRMAAAVGAVALGGMVAPSVAAEDCACDCYFSGDCQSGMFCNWGNLSIEDSCWWRRPKPQGQIGANCDEEMDDWGQCDGLCTATSAPGQAIAGETRPSIEAGLSAWADAMLSAGVSGGGVPGNKAVTAIHSMPFNDMNITYGLWRFTSEMMVLAVGTDAMVYPKREYEHPEVAVRALNAAQARNFELVMNTLLAEIDTIGSGRHFIDQIDLDELDNAMFERICSTGDVRECLYVRVQDIGDFIGGAWERRAIAQSAVGGAGPTCSGCEADVVPNDVVDFEDLLAVLSAWGQNAPAFDIDGSGLVGFGDLLALLAGWGNCVEVG